MNTILKEKIDDCIRRNKNLEVDFLYSKCKKEILNFQEENKVSCSEYDEAIKYICDELNY